MPLSIDYDALHRLYREHRIRNDMPRHGIVVETTPPENISYDEDTDGLAFITGEEMPVAASTFRDISYNGYDASRHTAIEFLPSLFDGEGAYSICTRGEFHRFSSGVEFQEVLNFALAVPPFNRGSIFPNPGSNDWALIANARSVHNVERAQIAAAAADEEDITTEEDTAMKSRASGPTEYSFIINCLPADDPNIVTTYELTPPRAQIAFSMRQWKKQRWATLAEAHQKCREYAGAASDQTGVREWNVWPRRNTILYRQLESKQPIDESLLKIVRAENPTSIKSFAALVGLVKEIKRNPVDIALEPKIQELIRFISWSKICNLGKASEIVSSKLNEWTKTDWCRSSVSDYTFIHPDNVIHVRTSHTAPEAYWNVSPTELHYHATECVHCHVYYRSGTLLNISGPNTRSCTDCMDELGFFNCRHCGEVHSSDRGCPSQRRYALGHIYQYSTDVRHVYPRYGDTERERAISGVKLRYGLELEVQARRDVNLGDAALHAATALEGGAILKADSSIGSNGFEIVSIPATLEFHKTQLWNKFFKKNMHGKIPSKMVQSWNTGVCGIHVHITRAAMTKMQLSKLLVFYHDDANNAFLSRIAGRTVGPDARYCKTAKKKLRNNVQHECADHHDAITISARNHGKTAEVRIFRGNATRHGVMRCLEFVDATVKWCGQAGGSKLGFMDFLTWFNQENIRSQYPDLWRHLIQLGYLKTKHRTIHEDRLLELPEADRVA